MGHWTFLWITDLHYELPEANYLDDPKEIKEKYNWPLRENVFTQCDQILEPGNFDGIDLSFIAIGGDVTTHGKPAGFTKFLEQTFPKLQNLVSRSEAICVVPGNHDVAWEIDPLEKGYFDKKFKDFRQMVKSADVTTCLFPSGELSQSVETSPQKLNFKLPDHGPVYVDRERHVVVLNVNSAIRCGELNRQMLVDIREYAGRGANLKEKKLESKKPPVRAELHSAPIAIDEDLESLKKYLVRDVSHVTQAQVTKLKEKMNQLKRELGDQWQSYLKVALVHHHVVHYPSQQTEHKGYEFMVDSPLLLAFLESFDFDIVLTGHKHQAYQRVERFKEKEMFVIGGPTVGGYTSERRGFRLVNVESNQVMRKVEIKDISADFAKGDIAEAIRTSEPIKLESTTPTKVVVDRAAQKVGYRYREIASMTVISPDGDAHRIVECEDLIVTKEGSPRAQRHPLNLPPTSGYLDQLRSTGKGITVRPNRQLSPDHSAQSANDISLEFDSPLDVGQPFSYRYEWLAVNSFAMDKLQFDRKYGDQEGLRNVEYTHFIPKDPVEDLTVLVQFPRGFKPQTAPSLRVAKVDATEANSRRWTIDHETIKQLKRNHALRYFDSLNAAAIRVKAPSTDLAYGIQWELPEAAVRQGTDQLEKIVQHFSNREACLKSVRDALKAGRHVLVPGWVGELDGSLMTFGMVIKDGKHKVGQLSTACALLSKNAEQDPNNWQVLESKTTLSYGRGIAGRAFKANRIRVYVAPKQESDFATSGQDDGRIAPDYYERIDDSVHHKAMVSFPLHVPVLDKTFQKEADIYENQEPYGVVNVGSGSAECPVSALLKEGRLQLLLFQHLVNKMMYEEAFPN